MRPQSQFLSRMPRPLFRMFEHIVFGPVENHGVMKWRSGFCVGIGLAYQKDRSRLADLAKLIRLNRIKEAVMEKGKPHVHADLECPIIRQKREVELGVNVFRSVDHGGLDVTACSEFLQVTGTPTCGKDCLHTRESRELHEEYVEQHQRELGKIGPNVIG